MTRRPYSGPIEALTILEGPTPSSGDMFALMDRTRAAIAKATGVRS